MPRDTFDRQSTTDQVGLKPQSRMQAPDANTGMVPIALPDAPMAPNLKDGGMNERQLPQAVGESVVKGGNFVANDGCKNP